MRGLLTNAQLTTTTAAIAVAAGTSVDDNATRAGSWKDFAEAAEAAAGASTTGSYMLRAAVALESLAGTSGAEENANPRGLLKRIVDALEATTGVGSGSLGARLAAAAVLWGGGTPPALTSSTTLASISGQPVAESVTTNRSCYCYLEGDDAFRFELIGAQPGTSWTLRKLNDDVFDFDNPEDFDEDNVYEITLILIGPDEIEVPVAITYEVEEFSMTLGNFTAQTGVARSTPIESNTITITALNVPSVTVEAEAGLEFQKNGAGGWLTSGTSALNDTFKARLTSSASYLTAVELDLTFNGNVVRSFSVTTLADPTAATFIEVATQPAAQNLGFSGATATFSVTFPAGHPVVYVAPQVAGRTISSVTVNGVSCGTPVVASTSGDAQGLYVCPTAVSAGTYNVVVTVNIAQGWFGILCGVLNNTTSLTPTSTARLNTGTTVGTHTTTSALTLASGSNVAVAFCLHYGLAPRTADTGTLISTGIAAGYNGEGGTGVYGMVSRYSTAGSWTPTFSANSGGNGAILAAVWG